MSLFACTPSMKYLNHDEITSRRKVSQVDHNEREVMRFFVLFRPFLLCDPLVRVNRPIVTPLGGRLPIL